MMWSIQLFFIINLILHNNLVHSYSVLSYGAKGDGKTDDTKAIQSAFNAASKGATITFDKGHSFLTGALSVGSNIVIDVQGTILASTNNALYNQPGSSWRPLISVKSGSNVKISGGGVIDGQGAVWWQCARTNNAASPCNGKARPSLFDVNSSNNIVIANLTFQNSPGSGITIEYSNNIHVYSVSVTAPSSSASVNPSINTDGIDVWQTQNVVIEKSYISVGDVAIAIESGQSPTKNVTFSYNKIGNSHGLAIGSWQNGGIQDITFKNIVIQGSDALDTGPNLIAARGRGNLTQNVLFKNIQMYNMGYCITMSMNFTHTNPPPSSNTPQYHNINFYNVSCTNSNRGWTIEGLPESKINANINYVTFTNVKTPIVDCSYLTGTCTNTNHCPPCQTKASG